MGPDNVADLAAGGRARWKVENEALNNLKTKVYHLEHNFGHGQQNLSTVLATLNLLAFACHTVPGRRACAPPAPARASSTVSEPSRQESALADVELPRLVTDHHRLAQEPMCVHLPPPRPLGGHAHRIGSHLQAGYAEARKMACPSFLVGKSPPLVRGHSLDQRPARV